MMKSIYMAIALLMASAAGNAALAQGQQNESTLVAARQASARMSSEEAGLAGVSEVEAKLWVLNAGYDQVSGLTRDGETFYRGTALLDGDTYDVVIDAAGNVLGVKE